MAQQTAVDWFHEKTWELKMLLEKQQISVGEYGVAYYDILEQAKEMFEQQMIDMYTEGEGILSESDFKAKQYYNETYNQNNNL